MSESEERGQRKLGLHVCDFFQVSLLEEREECLNDFVDAEDVRCECFFEIIPVRVSYAL